MASTLLTLMALLAACGFAHAQTDCLTLCNQYQFEESSARNVVRAQKHRASRSKGHLAAGSRQQDPSYGAARSSFCSMMCGPNERHAGGGISSRQSSWQYLDLPQGVENLLMGSTSGYEGSDLWDPSSLYPGALALSDCGSETSGLRLSGGGSQPSGSGSGSSSRGSGISSMSGMPQEAGGISSRQNALQYLGLPQEDASSLFSGVPGLFGCGSETSGLGSSRGGSQTSGSGSGSSAGASGMSSMSGMPQEAAYCEKACNKALRASGLSRILSSARQGAAHGHEERHGSRSSLPQHTRQNNGCPSFCHELLQGQGSSTGTSVGPTGEVETSASGAGGSHTGSQGSGGSVDGSTGGSEHSSNGK